MKLSIFTINTLFNGSLSAGELQYLVSNSKAPTEKLLDNLLAGRGVTQHRRFAALNPPKEDLLDLLIRLCALQGHSPSVQVLDAAAEATTN